MNRLLRRKYQYVRRFVMVDTVYVKMFEVSLSRYGIKSSKGYFHPRQLIALVTKPITAPPPDNYDSSSDINNNRQVNDL